MYGLLVYSVFYSIGLHIYPYVSTIQPWLLAELYKVLKLKNMSLQTLLFFMIVLFIPTTLHCHMNFMISLQFLKNRGKKCIWDFDMIMLNLYMKLGSIAILTSLPIHELGESFHLGLNDILQFYSIVFCSLQVLNFLC